MMLISGMCPWCTLTAVASRWPMNATNESAESIAGVGDSK